MFFRAERKTLLSVLVLFGFLFVIGCQKKEAEPEKKTEPVTQQQPAATQPAVDTTKKVEEAKPVVPDMKGTWTGKLDGYRAELKVTEQKDKKFSGTVTVHLTTVVDKTVTGEINLDKMTLSMVDGAAGKLKGKYAGTFSKDGKSVSGSFTYLLNDAKASFNFSKK